MSFSKTKLLFTFENLYGRDGYNIQQLSVGDFNGDGIQDYLVTRSLGLGGVPVTQIFLLGKGNNSWEEGTSLINGASLKSEYPARIAVADFNNDGQSDVYVPDSGLDTPPFGGAIDSLWISDGKGKLTDLSGTLSQKKSFAHGVTTGDINKDGYIDIVVNNIGPAEMVKSDLVLINDKDGTFTEKSSELLPPEFNNSLRTNEYFSYTWSKLIDINNDGWLDLVLASWDGDWKNYQLWKHPTIALLNDGTGSYARSVPITLPRSSFDEIVEVYVEPTDYNDDGFQDLIISVTNHAYSRSYLQFLTNDGTGHFTDETSYRLPQNSPINDSFWKFINVIDMNGDGFKDIVVIGGKGGSGNNAGLAVYLNNGNGTYREEKVFYTIDIPNAAVDIADVNSDNRPDIVAVNYEWNEKAQDIQFQLSAFLNDLASPNNLPKGTISIASDASENKVRLISNSIQDIDGLGDFAYQWYANQVPISGANQPTYALAQDDVGKPITVQVSYTDGFGNFESVLSNEQVMTQWSVEGAFGNDFLSGTNFSDFIQGLAGNDSLAGLAGDDTLDGGVGNDTLIGGTGNDTYHVDSKNDKIIENTVEGVDGILTSLTNFTLPSNIESLAYSGSKTFSGIGNALDNFIVGGAGKDTLSGLAGADTISGGIRADVLKGGKGSDTFAFSPGDSGQSKGFDVISDFTKGTSGDVIGFSSSLKPGGNANAAASDQASINPSSGIATFFGKSGTTLSDAISDVAGRMSAENGGEGAFAFFKVGNKGNYYLFISDGATGVTTGDVVIQLIGINTLSAIDLNNGNLAITT